jgi:hypothetical protein
MRRHLSVEKIDRSPLAAIAARYFNVWLIALHFSQQSKSTWTPSATLRREKSSGG